MQSLCFNLFFSFVVQAGIPDIVLLHISHLPVRLGQVPSLLLLQMVHSSGLHALSGGAVCGVGVQSPSPPSLCRPQPHSHQTGLGEDRSRGREQEIPAYIELLPRVERAPKKIYLSRSNVTLIKFYSSRSEITGVKIY